MLKLWGYKRSDVCSICGQEGCSLHHILSNCKTALKQQRYTWRHDSVLFYLQHFLCEHIRAHNTMKPKSLKPIPFVKLGGGNSKKRRPVGLSFSLLDSARDWELLVDLNRAKIVFPPEIYATPERPDIIIFSRATHRVLLVELTCPAEEGIEAARVYKEGRYAPLLAAINKNTESPWAASLLTIEAGARGFVAHSTHKFLRKVGVCPRSARAVCKDISLIVARCSYAIFLSRDAQNWDSKRALLSLHSKWVAEENEQPAPPQQVLVPHDPAEDRIEKRIMRSRPSRSWNAIPPLEFYKEPPGKDITC